MAIRFPARSIYQHLFSIVEIKNRREVEKEVYTRYIPSQYPLAGLLLASAGASFKRYITICIYFVVCENYARSTDAAMSLGRMADTVGDNKSSTTPLSTYSPKNICHTLLEEEKSQKGWFMREERGETLHLSFAVDYFKLNEPAHLNAITESVL